MKSLKLFLMLLLIFLLFFSGCFLTVTVNDVTVTQTSPAWIDIISASIIAAYEIIVRIIPSVKDYSALSFIINLLKKLSDNLNNRKPPLISDQ